MKNQITSHKMYSKSDYEYLKRKGYSETEILEIWNRDSKNVWQNPVVHQPIPDVVSVICGK